MSVSLENIKNLNVSSNAVTKTIKRSDETVMIFLSSVNLQELREEVCNMNFMCVLNR